MKIYYAFIIMALSIQHAVNAQCELLRGPVVINEFLPFNIDIEPNAIGLFEDYVELYNTSDQPVNMEGWFLSDSRGTNGRLKFRFPNVTIPGNGYLIVWCDGEGDVSMPGLNAAFSLSSTTGERVVLSNPDSVIVDIARFGPIDGNISIGRFPNGTGPFMTMIPSFNGPNFNGDDLNISINEYMATNSTTAADEFGEFDDWIELYNNSNTAINLSGYFLSDNENNPTKFTFPFGTVLSANEYLIVWADNQPEQGPLHASFALSAAGEQVIISRPDTSTVDFFAFGPQTTDVSEGRMPNGFGNLIPCMAPSFAEANLGTVSTKTPYSSKEMAPYPNPAEGYFHFENTANSNDVLRIYDVYGRLVKEAILSPSLNRIDISELKPAMYLIVNSTSSSRLIKSN